MQDNKGIAYLNASPTTGWENDLELFRLYAMPVRHYTEFEDLLKGLEEEKPFAVVIEPLFYATLYPEQDNRKDIYPEELVEQIKEKLGDPTIPIIAYTVLAEPKNKEFIDSLRKGGIDAIVYKTVGIENLISTLYQKSSSLRQHVLGGVREALKDRKDLPELLTNLEQAYLRGR